MADRDVDIDANLRDKTGPGVRSVERNLKKVEKSYRDVDGAGKKTLAAASQIAGQWGRGLSKVTGAASRWANSGDSAGKRFARGLGSGISKVGQLGATIGGGLSKAVSAAGPYVQVALAAVVVGAAVSAAPAIAGAIVGGAGLGGVVGGLLIASKDARVASAFDGLKEEVGSGLQEAAGRFVPASLEAVKEARSAFRGMMPDLRRLFDVSATWVSPLTRSVGRGLQSMVSGITQAVTKAGPVVRAIGSGIEMVGGAVGRVFADLSDNGTSMAAGLKGLFVIVAGAITNAGKALNFLVESFEFFVNRIPGGKAALERWVGASDGAKGSTLNLAGGFQALADDADAAASGLTKARQAADDAVDSNIGLAQAQIAARDATRQARQAIDENSKSKMTNKQRADANMTALLQMASAFNQEAEAGDKSKISAGAASAAYATNRQRLVEMAMAAGKSKAEAETLAARLLKIPKNVNTDVNVNTGSAFKQLATFQKMVSGLKGKTVPIRVQVLSNGNHRLPGGGQLTFDGAAGGGASWRSGGDGTARAGGPTPVQVESTVLVNLDGQPFRQMTARAIDQRERRAAWRQRMAWV
ncbi:hypothetical protein M3G91_10170 [Micromonospora chalcea]|uniref:hypothetical protein n=1 Tax=Micromonospora chalcea TaxID=1874 RepID=UPI0021A4C5B5|nr:hypothetical protein [Micromonospora chalcea]MCT2277990.1 hypothetical protein [Micromonospora chalcea]